jgi:hypothetical protein
VGDTVTVEITTDDLTGLDVFSYELTITWPSNRASCVEASIAGTLTEPWGSVAFNPQPGSVMLAAAGSVALSGGGTLINLRFVLGPNTGNATLTFVECIFNEGSPTASLTNGSLNISAPPSISISPNSGEITVGDSLGFSTSGGTPPYTYGTTDPAVADFAGTDYLKGISPGSVYAFVEDGGGLYDITTDPILIRAFKLLAGGGAGMPGDTVIVPMTITDPTAYGIQSAEFAVTYNEGRLTALGTIDTGTIVEVAGWMGSLCSISSGRIDISMAGANSLSGPGVLVYIQFVIDPITYNTAAALMPADGLFNEVFPPLHEAGTITITAFPSIAVSPNSDVIVIGDKLQFSVGGSPTPPLAWGVTNPTVAEIDETGELTALAHGSTRVFVTDDIGSTDTTDVFSICDLYVVAPDTTVPSVLPYSVPISPDRNVAGMGIYGYEMTLAFQETIVEFVGATTVGTATESWGVPIVNATVPGQVIIVHAGATSLSGSLPLIKVNFQGIPGTGGSTSYLNITNILFNEGNPCALVQNGSILSAIDNNILIPRMHLEQNFPNPFNPSTTIRYQLAEKGKATVRVYSPSGSLVRTLVDRFHEVAGCHEVRWDGRNDRGGKVASGVYLYRLDSNGCYRVKKMVLIK